MTAPLLAAGRLACAATPAAARVFPADGALDFRALRGGEAVGHRRQEIARSGADLVMRLDQELTLGPAARPRYRMVQHVEEVWREGWLHALVSDSEVSGSEVEGARWRVRAEREGGIFGGRVNGRGFTVSGYAITTSFWHRDTPSQEALLDITDARVKPMRGRLIGEEAVTLAGKPFATRHFRIGGVIQADLWYDGEARLLRLARPLPDGSEVIFEAA